MDNSNPDGAAYPPVIDTAQVAELLCMNVERVRRYVREGRLPAYQLPGSRVYRFIYSEVIDYKRGSNGGQYQSPKRRLPARDRHRPGG